MSPTYRKMAAVLGAALYMCMPLDLIPDVIVPVGYLDDLAVAVLAALYRPRDRRVPAATQPLTPGAA